MICFRDRTYCSHEQHDADCDRQWTPELSAAAEKWWGKPGAPVAFGPMCSGIATPTDDRSEGEGR